ncbi:MAG TPA: DUF2069 domain-containing protein [Burkholderiales bacterium]|nr:DUF2069 domain-containing protein [Burkholderiales bacterium]
MVNIDRLRALSSALLVALVALCLAWELWLAPLRPGGSYVALKAMPLILPFNGIVQGKRRTYQWSCMLVLAYLSEGAVRAWSERGTAQHLAFLEIALSLAFFAAAIGYARATRNP